MSNTITQAITVWVMAEGLTTTGPCGDGCPCLTIAKKAGTCACGKPLVQTKIDKISRGKAYVKVNGKTETFKLTGKYVCGCGAGCDCNTISQTAGKCACGKDLKPVKTTKKPAA
jgi:hypothetical protein